jgi:hypothetical protein
MWSKESFYTSNISRNSLDPEMLMGGWDILSAKGETRDSCWYVRTLKNKLWFSKKGLGGDMMTKKVLAAMR